MSTWIWLGIVAFVICACASIAQDAEKAADAAKAAEAEALRARLAAEAEARRIAELERQRSIKARGTFGPDILKQMLAEEFPYFAGDFTFTRCEDAIDWISTAIQPGRPLGLHLTSGGEFRDDFAAHKAGLQLCDKLSGLFSAGFAEWGRQNPAAFARLFMRVYNAAQRRTESL